MGVNHGGQGDESPEFGVGTLMETPPDCVMFQNFMHQIACITMQQCSNRLINLIILTDYSLFPKSTSSLSTKSPLQAENSTFLA